jgi:hypothetical protein
MHPLLRRAARWPLLIAFALAATVFGHAIELALENAGVLGDGRAAYSHNAQGPIEFFILGLTLFTIIALAVSVFRSIGSRQATIASIVPAFAALRRMGTSKIALLIAGVQFPALIAAEICEQRVSGFAHPGLAAIFGAGHVTAPIIQLAMTALAALALAAFARMSCEHADDLLRAAHAIARIFVIAVRQAPRAALVASVFARAEHPIDHPLAFRLANRPPPAIAAARA